MKALHKNEKGFTLVELMVVVVIIGILVAIAIPIYGAVQNRAEQGAHEANERILKGAASMYIAEHGRGTYPDVNLGDYVEETWPIEDPRDSTLVYKVDIADDGSVDVDTKAKD